MAKTRPYYISIWCKELEGMEYRGRHFEKGYFIAMIAAANVRALIEKSLREISAIVGQPVRALTCEVKQVEEISLERAQEITKILSGARPTDEINR